MKNVTRTIVTMVARYTDAFGEQRVTILNMLEPSVIQSLVKDGATDMEMGYVPCLYSMSTEEFIKNAKCLTDLSKADIYATEDDCPTRAERNVNKEN